MAKSNSSSEAVVNDLLAERTKYETFITRLDSTKDTTPAAVRTKVLADYKSKLDGVLARLTEHADAVREQLEQRKVRRDELTAEETKAKETLAEAELRHAVGEYDEGDWVKVRAESNKILVGAREELSKVLEDIERLAEVSKLIATPVAPPPPPPPPPAPPAPPKAPEPAPAVAETAPPKRDSGRAEFVPSTPKAKPPADELEFLRSTVGENDEAPAPTRTVKVEKERKPKPEAAAAPAPAVSGAGPAISESDLSGPLPKPSRAGENRTLKCPECGTMNRATEWYCERCGSELAGV